MKKAIKALAFRAFPETSLRLFSIRSRRVVENDVRKNGLDALARKAAQATNGMVAKGPFSGMWIDYDALPVHGAPKFLGTYEQELHGCIEQLISLSPPNILNVGCEMGFYAVGLALRLPRANVYAADADPKAVRATKANAELNEVTVTGVGIIRPGDFSKYLTPGSAVIMDCEGGEFDLLDPDRDDALRHSHIIVEVHPEFGSATTLSRRFANTHKITKIAPTARSHADIPVGFDGDGLRAIDERAGPKEWLYMEVEC